MGAQSFADDAESCPNQFFTDAMSRAHWKAHSNIVSLLGLENRSEIMAAALLVADNTAAVERQHATSRRGAAPHEQTYADAVAASSARHV